MFSQQCLVLSLETGATKLPKLSRKRRAFQEPCSSFHHETIRIIYSQTIFKYMMVVFSFMWHRSTIWMTLKQLSHDMTKPTKWVCAQQRLRSAWHPPSLIRVFTVRMKKTWVLSYPLSAQRRLWSDWAGAQADLSLRWAHSHFVGFVMSWLIRRFILTTAVQGCS